MEVGSLGGGRWRRGDGGVRLGGRSPDEEKTVIVEDNLWLRLNSRNELLNDFWKIIHKFY